MERQRPSLGGAVFPGRIHRLQDQQHRLAVGGVEQLLQVAQIFHLFLQARGDCLSDWHSAATMVGRCTSSTDSPGRTR